MSSSFCIFKKNISCVGEVGKNRNNICHIGLFDSACNPMHRNTVTVVSLRDTSR